MAFVKAWKKLPDAAMAACAAVALLSAQAQSNSCDSAFFDDGSDSAKTAPSWVPGTTSANQLPKPLLTWESGKLVLHSLQENGAKEDPNTGSPKPCIWAYPKNWTLKDYWLDVDVYPGGNHNGLICYFSVTLRNITTTPWKNFIMIQFPDNADEVRLVSFCEGPECGPPWCVPDHNTKHEPVMASQPFTFRSARPNGKIHVRAEAKGLDYKAIIDGKVTIQANETGKVPEANYHTEGPPGICTCFDKSAFDNFLAGGFDCQAVPTRSYSIAGTAPAKAALRLAGCSRRGASISGTLAVTVHSAGEYEVMMTDAMGKTLWYYRTQSQGAHVRELNWTVPVHSVVIVSFQQGDEAITERFTVAR
jgi:hypothetical protein